MTTTTITTIHLIFQGIPIDITVADLGNLAEIKQGLVQAKKLGFEGQPLARSFGGGFGGKGGRPASAAPVRDAKGQLCCPTHAGDKRGTLQKKDWANGAVWACGCKDDGQWCTYKLDAAQYEEFKRSVPKAAPAPAPAQPTVAEARAKFFAAHCTILGGDTWARVQAFWGDDRLIEPATVEGWREEYLAIQKELKKNAA